jgi:outer membrane protein assembly factor BamB
MADSFLPATALPAAPRLTVPPPAALQRRLRLWVPILAVSAYWILGFLIGRMEKLYFLGFLYGMASSGLLALVFLGWWWLNGRIRLVDRAAGFLLMAAAAAAVAPLCHPSINLFVLLLSGLPIVLTACTVWMLVSQRIPAAWRRPGAAMVVLLAWGFCALVRLEGIDSSLRADFHWRWTPSAEELFLQEAATEEEETPADATKWEPAIGDNDWTGFRGPQRDGVLGGIRIPADWKTNPPKERWRHRVGPAWSSVVVLGGRLFTQEQRGEKETVVCYDADTGKRLWVHGDTTRFLESVSGAGPRATPTYAKGRLYTMGATGRLNCLDAAGGKVLWSRDVAGEAGTKPPSWGYSSSPLVVKEKVIVYAGGKEGKGVLAYHARSGEPVWSAPAGGTSYSSPQLTTLAGKPQVLMLHDEGLSAFDPADGAVLWTAGTPMSGAPKANQPHAFSSSALLVGGLEGLGIARVDVARENGQWKADQAWNSSRLKPEFPDQVVHNGHAYGFDVSIFCCIDTATGEQCWKEGRYGRGQVILLAEQSLLVVLSEKGQAVQLAANPERHQELGHFQALKGKTWNHPVIADGRLYARNAEEMACYDLEGTQADRPGK